MALLSSRDISETHVDDQSPTLRNSYVGNWTHYYDGNTTKWYFGTYTATPNPGASFSFNFSGTQLLLYGGVADADVAKDGSFISYPNANYWLDGSPVGPQPPFRDPSQRIIYFQSLSLEYGTHTINLTVTTASPSNPFIIDWYSFSFPADEPSSGVHTPASTSTPTIVTHPTRVSTIVGSVVGGLTGLAILTIALYYFLKRRSRGEQAYDFEKPNLVDGVVSEYHAEPFDPTVSTQGPTPANLNGPGPQSPNSNGSSNWPLSPPFRLSGVGSLPSLSYQSDNPAQPQTGNVVLAIEQNGDAQEPVRYEDSGVRFSVHEGEPGPPQPPKDVPPTYTRN